MKEVFAMHTLPTLAENKTFAERQSHVCASDWEGVERAVWKEESSMNGSLNTACCLCARMKLAEAYVPDQPLDCLYPPEDGLRMGTVFPNLSRPYGGWRKILSC